MNGIKTFLKRYAASLTVLLIVTCIAVMVLAISVLFGHSDSNAVRLQAEASGECFRVNYLRWNVNRVVVGGYRRDVEAAKFLHREHLRRLSRVFENAAQSAAFLPLTDCEAATAHPRAYYPPGAIQLAHVPNAELRAALHNPPVPPN